MTTPFPLSVMESGFEVTRCWFSPENCGYFFYIYYYNMNLMGKLCANFASSVNDFNNWISPACNTMNTRARIYSSKHFPEVSPTTFSSHEIFRFHLLPCLPRGHSCASGKGPSPGKHIQ